MMERYDPDDINQRLDRLLVKLSVEEKDEAAEKPQTISYLMALGLTREEAEAWLETEPSYDKSDVIRRKVTERRFRRRGNRICGRALVGSYKCVCSNLVRWSRIQGLQWNRCSRKILVR